MWTVLWLFDDRSPALSSKYIFYLIYVFFFPFSLSSTFSFLFLVFLSTEWIRNRIYLLGFFQVNSILWPWQYFFFVFQVFSLSILRLYFVIFVLLRWAVNSFKCQVILCRKFFLLFNSFFFFPFLEKVWSSLTSRALLCTFGWYLLHLIVIFIVGSFLFYVLSFAFRQGNRNEILLELFNTVCNIWSSSSHQFVVSSLSTSFCTFSMYNVHWFLSFYFFSSLVSHKNSQHNACSFCYHDAVSCNTSAALILFIFHWILLIW